MSAYKWWAVENVIGWTNSHFSLNLLLFLSLSLYLFVSQQTHLNVVFNRNEYNPFEVS